MSYCVNCGVELDQALSKCPLCNTRVVNPANEQDKKTPFMDQPDHVSTFPQKHGQVESVRRRDMGLLLTIVLCSTAFSSLMLNLFLLKGNLWSLLIIGVCVILFFLAFPAVIYTKTPLYISLLFDGFSIALYLYFITFVTSSKVWFYDLALPIVGLITLLVLFFVWLIRSFKVSILATGIYLFTEIAFFCVGLELMIDRYLQQPLSLFWSAIVLTVCAVIDSALITVLSRRRLRDAVQRRLHF